MLIELPDAVALRYSRAAEAAHVSLPKFLERQLVRVGHVPPSQRVLLLTGEALEQIDQLLGLGSTASPDALLTAVRSWAGITIGNIRIPFTPAQLDEIAHRAEKQGKPPQAIVEDIVQQMGWRFFEDAVVAR